MFYILEWRHLNCGFVLHHSFVELVITLSTKITRQRHISVSSLYAVVRIMALLVNICKEDYEH